uniref:3-hydroxyisobutyryl-CoA hydrolase n=1 Tax=Vitis vinifera TaxID=29760 RepID=F6I042_VITVI
MERFKALNRLSHYRRTLFPHSSDSNSNSLCDDTVSSVVNFSYFSFSNGLEVMGVGWCFQVLVEGKASSRIVTLNRPHVLNAVVTPMGVRLIELYESWEKDPHFGFVVIKGSGKAFSAGGDVVCLYQFMDEGRLEDCKDCFRTFYSLMYLIHTYMKPHVALIDGVTMGAGAGISVLGTFCVATDRTVFGTPEALIGFHPDGGASYFLSHLPGYLGEYMGLTGATLSGAEMVACGLATHYSLSAKIPLIEEQLKTLLSDDPSVIEAVLAKFSDVAYPDERSVLCRIEMLDKCFGHDTVEEIVNALESEATGSNDPWCISTLKKLRQASPLSLKIALRSIRESRSQTLEECLIREYRISVHAISRQISSDFYEGVRARLVDRNFAPKWNPPRLEDVSEDMVDCYFLPLGEYEPELELPKKLQEAFD